MKLLQGDRRANIEIIQANKDGNRDEIKRLRDDNNDLRKKIVSIRRSVSGNDAGDTDIAKHMNEAVKCRKTYDTIKLQCSANKKELQELKDEVKQLELEARRPNQEDSPLTRNIRMLENRLDKAMIKYNEAQSIRKTYEQIVKRLRDERIGFDSQLSALERSMAAKQRDYEELLLLSGDANHAQEVAMLERDRVRIAYEDEQHQRERDLRAHHKERALRKQTEDLLKKRAEKHANIHATEEMKESGRDNDQDNNDDDGNGFRSSNSKTMSTSRIDLEKKENKTKIDIFEAAFRKIKDATGVSDVNEVISKIVSQEGTTENLMILTKENQSKIEHLGRIKDATKQRVEELKYSGPEGGGRRKKVDDLEEALTASNAKLERCRLKHERMSSMLIAVKAGVKHLLDKVAPTMRTELGGIADMHTGELDDSEVATVLSDVERAVVRLVQRIKAAAADELELLEEEGGGGEEGGGNISSDAALLKLDSAPLMAEDLEAAVLKSRPNNQRIELPKFDDGWGDPVAGVNNQWGGNDKYGEGKEYDGGEEEDDELTRDKVKKASNQMLVQQQKREAKAKLEREKY
jgi:hypothetical protein